MLAENSNPATRPAERNPWILIPIFFNVILAMGLPFMRHGTSLTELAPLLLLGFLWPWVMYFIVGRIIDHTVKEARKPRRSRDSQDPPDFV